MFPYKQICKMSGKMKKDRYFYGALQKEVCESGHGRGVRFSLQPFLKTSFSPCRLQRPGSKVMLSMAISLARSDPLTPSKTI